MSSERGFYHSSMFIEFRRFSAKRVLCASKGQVATIRICPLGAIAKTVRNATGTEELRPTVYCVQIASMT